MRFHAEHRFDAPGGAVMALLGDPDFYLGLDLPDLSRPEVLEYEQDGGGTVLSLRYEFEGSLDPIAQRLLDSSRLAWVQTVRIDPQTGTGTLSFEAEKDPTKLHGQATFSFAGADGATVRNLEGDLVVAVPAIGRMAERRIVPGILRRLDIEAQAAETQLEGAR